MAADQSHSLPVDQRMGTRLFAAVVFADSEAD